MGNYSKLWGSALGGIVGLGVAYGVVPEDKGSMIMTTTSTLLPLIFSMFGTYIAPKNSGL